MLDGREYKGNLGYYIEDWDAVWQVTSLTRYTIYSVPYQLSSSSSLVARFGRVSVQHVVDGDR
jgi:hypothetical protein